MAILYEVAAFANSSRSQERSDNRFDNKLASCFLIIGGWYDLALT